MIENQTRILKICAVGSALSVLMLIVMAVVTSLTGVEYPGIEILTGEVLLSENDFHSYSNTMQILFILDSIFLLGWLFSWLGICKVAYTRIKIFSILSLIFGISGAIFDFCENSIIWSVIQALQIELPMNNDWGMIWKTIQHLSYLFPFIGAIFASCGLWSGKVIDKFTAMVGTLFTVAALIGLYLPGLSIIPNLWFLFWFACCAILLWQHANESSSTSN